jgi:hypothetical protein
MVLLLITDNEMNIQKLKLDKRIEISKKNPIKILNNVIHSKNDIYSKRLSNTVW